MTKDSGKSPSGVKDALKDINIPDESKASLEDLVARMQTPEALAGLEAAFNASPQELGRAAVKAARKQ